jgi:RHS repeat-associated protein
MAVLYPGIGPAISNTATGFHASQYVDFRGRPRCTSKERDAETGLDYFGARYFSGAQGRFTTVDPLMASAYVSNPQSWNRYTYALNNPLRFVDPNGIDVPAACAEDKNCQIVVKVNVVYDKIVHSGKGLTDKERQIFEKNQLEKAQKDFGNSNIKLQFTYTQGSYTANDSGQTQLIGWKSDSLNLVVSTTTPSGEAGVSGLAGNGTAVSFLNFSDVNNSNVGPLWSNTTEPEMGHQFLGDPQTRRTPGVFEHMGRDMQIDSMNTAQGRGVSQSGYRQGLEPRAYAVPANPEANKPQKK